MVASPGQQRWSMSAITVTTRPDGVAVLTFDQPGSKANVLTRELWTEFGEALAGLASRTDLKGLVLASAKPGIFIAGADLKLLANASKPNDPDVRAFIEQGLRVLEQLEALPFPTCAAIDGAALGGGLEVALACDVIAVTNNPKVQLGLPEVKLGLIPGWGGTQRLRKFIPPAAVMSKAADLLTTGRSISAPQAITDYFLAGFGLFSESYLDDVAVHASQPRGAGRVAEDREQKRRPLPQDARTAFQAPTTTTKAESEAMRVMVQGAALPLYEAIKLETEAFMKLAGTSESKRLIAEFFAARKK